MVSTLTWVLVGLVVYTLAMLGLKARGWLPSYVGVSGPLTTISTTRGRDFLDRLAAPRRFWRAYANVGLGVGLVVMFLTFLMLVLTGILAFEAEPTAVTEPRNALVIPGVNQFIPLSVTPYVIVGLVIGLVVHEGGHGLLCRVEGIDIERMGVVFFAFVPLGAFVEPNEDSRAAADRGGQTRMFVAGVTNNFVVGAVALLLLFGPVVGAIAVVDGYHVGGAFDGAPADRAGVGAGDVIVSVNGTDVEDADAFEDRLAELEGANLALGLQDGSEVTVTRELFVRGAPANSPLPLNTTITAVNDTAVHSVDGFKAAIQDRHVARLSTPDGDVALPMGALVGVVDGGPFAAAGAPGGEHVVVTEFDGERITDSQGLQRAIDQRSPGDEIDVVAYGYPDGERTTYTVELGDRTGDSYLGVAFDQAGTTGLVFSELGIEPYPAEFFLGFIGGDAGPGLPGGVFGQLIGFIFLPFMGVILPNVSASFAGFVGVAANFYTVEGGLAVLGTGGVFALANVLLWTAWINIIVGQFNLIPAFPLDGGHILRTSTEAVVSRLPVANKRALTRVVTISVGLLMLLSIVAAFTVPRLLH